MYLLESIHYNTWRVANIRYCIYQLYKNFLTASTDVHLFINLTLIRPRNCYEFLDDILYVKFRCCTFCNFIGSLGILCSGWEQVCAM